MNYGAILFKKEIEYDIEKILTCLVNTRVNIMHIKIKQRIPKFDGSEATLYAMKMSYLYRLVILDLLKIDKEIYMDKLNTRVSSIDGWNDVQNKLFKRLNNKDN